MSDPTAPDLSWDNPEIPAGGWQGIQRLDLRVNAPSAAPRAVLHVILLEPLAPSFPLDFTVRISGPQPLSFNVVPVPSANDIEVDFDDVARGTFFVTVVPTSPGPTPVHPFFATASFTFSIDCERDDCRPPTTTPLAPSAEGAPAVDLLTKDFNGFLQLLGGRVQVRNPDWTDISSASFEAVLVELLAHQADMLSYFQDRVANEAFLDTATQRFSIREHGLLLGQELFDGASATTLLSFTVAPAVSAAFTVPSGLSVRAPRRPDEAQVVFAVTRDTRVDPARNRGQLQPAQWPDAFSARVPVGATSLLLLGHATALAVGERIAFALPGSENQVRTLTQIELLSLPGWVASPSDPLTTASAAVTRIHWSEGLSVELPIWSSDLDPGTPGAQPGVPFEIHANLVDAQHGQWQIARLRSEATTLDDAQPDIPLTPQSAIIVRSPLGVWQLRALRLLDGPQCFDQVDGVRTPALQVTLDGQTWFRQEHLESSQPFDRHFTAETDNDHRLWLRFGDGVRGQAIELTVSPDQTVESAKLAGDSELRIRYRVGAHLLGNIDADKLIEIPTAQSIPGLSAAQITALLSELSAVTNVTPGSGGQQPETLDAARLAIPSQLRHGDIQRAVTLDDYARFSELREPRVARAVARSLGGPFNTVLVLVDPRGEAALDDALKSSIEQALDQGRMVGREVLVRGADSVPLDVNLTVCVAAGFEKSVVKQDVLRALRPGSADHPGFFHPDRLSFGQDVLLSDLLSEVQSVPGVLAVKAVSFQRLRAEKDQVVPRIVLSATEVARLDADDLNPENGRLIVNVPGLDLIDSDFVFVRTPEAQGAHV
ncbi:MAG TPA: hypothetical protein VGJ91_22610 [Polyangiaceae bacterium]|jgi:hypothetical protein